MREGWDGAGFSLEKKFQATQVFDILKKYCGRKVISTIVAASLLIQMFAIAIPLFSQIIVDKVLVHQNQSALYVFGILMAIMVCAELLFSCARIKIMIDAGKKIDAAISHRVYQAIIGKPLSFYQENRVGSLVNMARKANITSPLIASGTLFNSLDLVFTTVFFTIMLGYSLALSTLCLGIVIIVSSFNFWATGKRSEDDYTDPTVDLTEALYGIESLKLSGREGLTLRKFESSIVEQAQSLAKTSMRSNLLLSLNMWMQRIGMLCTLWIGANLVIDGQLSMGQLIAFQMFASRVFHPAARMAYTIRELRKAFTDLKDLSSKINVAINPAKHQVNNIDSIELKNVSFTHTENQPIICGINIFIKKAAKIGIIGSSGSGKSTLLKLIVNIHSPQKGSLLVNGINIRHIDDTLLRMRIVLVPQQSFLFRGSILENVAPLGSVVFDDNIFKYIDLLELDDLIDSHPDGLNRAISESGSNFSGGQRQKLCLLRALMMRPDVLLLDESTSALDEQTELRIHHKLLTHLTNTTIITVSHRPSSLIGYDAIYRMNNGNLELIEDSEGIKVTDEKCVVLA
ncbi:peptidase domain-containing ABC transporter [Pseudomonas viridiflava]|uniref:peptidase domain-containing ABC transporter n=1 Tax=Pseudomonas viridiflava TaxID=33069 RepID=UPI002EBA8321|nr:ATP-binding cassette domain-containing protein [Pseudomonas viridiflava]MEE3976017.1 ATP-binding cassette domain-containing protein [Pseudomonas viridiflava]MEE4021075.1 ATP-binding cassette domain-containing protein [Pseudomonas viridiflava]